MDEIVCPRCGGSDKLFLISTIQKIGTAVGGGGKITLELDTEPEHCELFTLDEQHDLEQVLVVCNGNVIEINCNSDSAVQLLKLSYNPKLWRESVLRQTKTQTELTN